jgi:AdoMet-dependent rRNA methyltransferase SPB1
MVRAPRRGDADEEDGEESEEGGWDVTAAVKAKLGEEADSSDDDDEGDDAPAEKPKKKTVKFERSIVAPKPVAGGSRLVTSLQEPEQRAQMSRQAQVWFDQSVFKGVGDLAALDGDDEDDEDDEMEDDEDDESLEEDEDVDMEEASTLSSTLEDEEVCTGSSRRVIR